MPYFFAYYAILLLCNLKILLAYFVKACLWDMEEDMTGIILK